MDNGNNRSYRITKSLDQRRPIVIVRIMILRVIVVLEQIQQEADYLRRTNSMGGPQPSHGHRNGLLQKVVLKVGEIVLPYDVWRTERSEKFLEYGQHGRGTLPGRDHRGGYFRQTEGRLAAHFIEHLLVLDGVRQG